MTMLDSKSEIEKIAHEVIRINDENGRLADEEKAIAAAAAERKKKEEEEAQAHNQRQFNIKKEQFIQDTALRLYIARESKTFTLLNSVARCESEAREIFNHRMEAISEAENGQR